MTIFLKKHEFQRMIDFAVEKKLEEQSDMLRKRFASEMVLVFEMFFSHGIGIGDYQRLRSRGYLDLDLSKSLREDSFGRISKMIDARIAEYIQERDKGMVADEAKAFIRGEDFIDRIVDRIRKKQIPGAE